MRVYFLFYSLHGRLLSIVFPQTSLAAELPVCCDKSPANTINNAFMFFKARHALSSLFPASPACSSD